MNKPLSPGTLEKRYAALDLTPAKVAELTDFYTCLANLYGVITVGEAWPIYRDLNGPGPIRKKDFVAFSEVAARDAAMSAAVIEMKEVFPEEEDTGPEDRLIVNRELIGSGYYRYSAVYAVESTRPDELAYFLPDDLAEFYGFRKDPFYTTAAGKRMTDFVNGLRSRGISLDRYGKENGRILDVNGEPVEGKRLSEAVFYNEYEKGDLAYYKSEAKKKQLTEEFTVPASRKILKQIKEDMHMMPEDPEQRLMGMKFLLADLAMVYGVLLTDKELRRFLELYDELYRTSNLWNLCGWTPEEMEDEFGNETPSFRPDPPASAPKRSGEVIDFNEYRKNKPLS